MITSPSEMSKLAHTYASIMPDWMTDHFVSPDMELHLQRIKTHEYCESNSARHMRKMDDVHLVDFIELELKGKEPFGIAYDVALASGLKSYLKKFVVLQPGDWPAQFYCRQLVYENPYMYRKKCQPIPNDESIEESEENNNLNRVDDHTYMYSHNVRSEQTASNYSIRKPLSPLASVVPMIDPLHVSLNSKEHIMLSFWPFFKKVYEQLFPNTNLPDKPKPWQINLILEIVYGGWVLIRATTLQTFSKSKNLQYGTRINLLDNYLPLVLTIYSVAFKSNNSIEYISAMIRIWVLFTCLKRRHYNKAPLAWLSTINHWGKYFPKLYDVMKKWQIVSDEYPVENIHSIIRAQTQETDTADTLSNKVKAIFQSKQHQNNFRKHFTPPKTFSFSIKMKAGNILADILQGIVKNLNHSLSPNPKNRKRIMVKMPTLFGDEVMNECVLPLGFHGDRPPNEESRCDLSSCCIRSDDDWKVLTGCWHSFHKACLLGSEFCPLCKETLVDQLQQLSITAKEAITSVYPQKPTTSPPEQLTKIERDSFNKVLPLSSDEKTSSIKSINEDLQTKPSSTQESSKQQETSNTRNIKDIQKEISDNTTITSNIRTPSINEISNTI